MSPHRERRGTLNLLLPLCLVCLASFGTSTAFLPAPDLGATIHRQLFPAVPLALLSRALSNRSPAPARSTAARKPRFALHRCSAGYASDRKAAEFCAWLQKRGAEGIGSTVEVRCTSDGQYGLFATREIAAGERVLSLPMATLSLSEESVFEHAQRDSLQRCLEAVME
eukprot:2399241-Rhodomonas_salina.1